MKAETMREPISTTNKKILEVVNYAADGALQGDKEKTELLIALCNAPVVHGILY